jgi:hypothetical protein
MLSKTQKRLAEDVFMVLNDSRNAIRCIKGLFAAGCLAQLVPNFGSITIARREYPERYVRKLISLHPGLMGKSGSLLFPWIGADGEKILSPMLTIRSPRLSENLVEVWLGPGRDFCASDQAKQRDETSKEVALLAARLSSKASPPIALKSRERHDSEVTLLIALSKLLPFPTLVFTDNLRRLRAASEGGEQVLNRAIRGVKERALRTRVSKGRMIAYRPTDGFRDQNRLFFDPSDIKLANEIDSHRWPDLRDRGRWGNAQDEQPSPPESLRNSSLDIDEACCAISVYAGDLRVYRAKHQFTSQNILVVIKFSVDSTFTYQSTVA